MGALTFAEVQNLAVLAPQYLSLRASFPAAPAKRVVEYLKNGHGETFEQYWCNHKWSYTGTAYGGDDESYNGEGRCYCSKCGADGDA